MVWLIAGLAERGIHAHPSKIERIQRVGLGPRPNYHRHPSLSGSEMWPVGALEHYLAVVPLVRQRHSATEIAALTMMCWGFPVDIDLLRRSYARAAGIGDFEQQSEDLLAHYENRGMPVFRKMLAHIRSHGLGTGRPADQLAYEVIQATLNQAMGTATSEQVRLLLAAALPKFGQAPQAVIEWVIQLFRRIQSQLSLPALLETVKNSSTEELLSVRKETEDDLVLSLKNFGSTFQEFCRECEETRGLIVGFGLPLHVALHSIDFDALLAELGPTMPTEFLNT